LNLSIELFVGIRLIIVGMVENEQGYEDFMDTSVQKTIFFFHQLFSILALNYIFNKRKLHQPLETTQSLSVALSLSGSNNPATTSIAIPAHTKHTKNGNIAGQAPKMKPPPHPCKAVGHLEVPRLNAYRAL